MDNPNHEHENDANQLGGFVAGLLMGGLAGAGAMLLLAPQSGKKTRTEIQRKGIELRKQTTEAMEDALKQAGVTARHISVGVHKQAEALEQHGQDAIDEQRDHLGKALTSLGKAVRA
jgi:gas vesicle protein